MPSRSVARDFDHRDRIRALCAIEHRENNILFYSTPRTFTRRRRRRRRSLTYHIIIILYYFPACAGRDYPAGGCGYIIFKEGKKIPSHLMVVPFIVYIHDIYIFVFWAYLYYMYTYTGCLGIQFVSLFIHVQTCGGKKSPSKFRFLLAKYSRVGCRVSIILLSLLLHYNLKVPYFSSRNNLNNII